jgi:hypothetical protein
MTLPFEAAQISPKLVNRRGFIGGSDAQVIMGSDEAAAQISGGPYRAAGRFCLKRGSPRCEIAFSLDEPAEAMRSSAPTAR